MAKKISIVKENSFEGAPGGFGGTMNYGTTYGTPAGGNTTQDPSKFSSSDKTTNHMDSNTESTSSAMIKLPDRPDRQDTNISSNSANDQYRPEDLPSHAVADYQPIKNTKPNTVDFTNDKPYDEQPQDNSIDTNGEPSPSGEANNIQAGKPLDPSKQLDPKVDKIFQKKNTPSPDDVMAALEYEMSRMVKKDKLIAKQIVLKNMQKDPYFYSRLHMLNIDDKAMQVDESKFSKTKKVLDDMVADKQRRTQNNPIAESKELQNIFKDLYKKRYGR
jgi:hypothetical protein